MLLWLWPETIFHKKLRFEISKLGRNTSRGNSRFQTPISLKIGSFEPQGLGLSTKSIRLPRTVSYAWLTSVMFWKVLHTRYSRKIRIWTPSSVWNGWKKLWRLIDWWWNPERSCDKDLEKNNTHEQMNRGWTVSCSILAFNKWRKRSAYVVVTYAKKSEKRNFGETPKTGAFTSIPQ